MTRVVHVGFYADPQRRAPEALLRAWPTLPGVAAAAARAGVDVTVVQAAAAHQTLEREGVAYHFVDDARPTRARLVDRVSALAPDVVHVHGLHFPLGLLRLARALPEVPVLVQDHASGVPNGWRRHAWRLGFRRVAAVAFTARAQAEAFFAARVLRRDTRVFEVLEGSCAFTPGDRAAARRATGISGEPAFLWTGHLDANKGPLTVLAAFGRAAPALPDARLWCCYQRAPLLGAVRRAIADSPALRGRVTLLGARPHAEMQDLFRAADFHVQASHHEGSGYSVIEAMACGTPPLVTDLPSFRRIVDGAGSLTPVGDGLALAASMVAWADRDPLARRRAARARFDEALSYTTIGRELRAAYEALVEAS